MNVAAYLKVTKLQPLKVLTLTTPHKKGVLNSPSLGQRALIDKDHRKRLYTCNEIGKTGAAALYRPS